MTIRPLHCENITEEFNKAIADHQMSTVLDQGMHRHLRFQRPGDSTYWFDIVTWPGCLTIHGDMGSYVFSGGGDMFEFFNGPGINPHYWARKLRAHSGVSLYSAREFRRRVLEWADELLDEEADDIESSMTGKSPGCELHQALEHELFYYTDQHEDETRARESLENFSCEGIRFDNAWGTTFHEWDNEFLWCCHAIKHAILCYRAAEDARGAHAEPAS